MSFALYVNSSIMCNNRDRSSVELLKTFVPNEFLTFELNQLMNVRGFIRKFPGWPPGARSANDTALCH
jgi:hypothetical protein